MAGSGVRHTGSACGWRIATPAIRARRRTSPRKPCFAPGVAARRCGRPTGATSGWRRSSATRHSAARPRPPGPDRGDRDHEGAEDAQIVATVERADLHAALDRLGDRDRRLLELRYERGPDPGGDRAPARHPRGDREGAPAPRPRQAAPPVRAAVAVRPAPPVHAGERAARNFGPLYNRSRSISADHLPMKTVPRQIVAFGGGGFSMESGNRLLDDYVLGLTGAERPRVCFLPSASGDADHYIVRFYRAFSAHRCEATHISLFRREQGPEDLRAHLLSQDLIYVGGGSVVSLLGVWRAHGIDQILREAWEAGVILCGLSAGSLCWFAEAVTGFHGAPKRLRGIGLLPVQQLRPLRARLQAQRVLPPLPARGDARRLRGRGRRRPALHRHRTEPRRRLAAGGARLPARRRRAARGRDADRHHLPRRPRGRPAAPVPEALSTAVAV